MRLLQVFVASEVHSLATLREFVWDSIRGHRGDTGIGGESRPTLQLPTSSQCAARVPYAESLLHCEFCERITLVRGKRGRVVHRVLWYRV